jgi:TonB family protein
MNADQRGSRQGSAELAGADNHSKRELVYRTWHEKRRDDRVGSSWVVGRVRRQDRLRVGDVHRFSKFPSGKVARKPGSDGPVADSLCKARVSRRGLQAQGDVTVLFWIDTEGTVEKATVVDGHPPLAQAAIEAVKQWRYTPYLLNGEPIEVEIRTVVSFGK